MGPGRGSRLLTADELAAQRERVANSPELGALLRRLSERARPFLARRPPVPPWKALLSTSGGVCSRDGAALEFDPWAAGRHRCPRCGTIHQGERHDRWWARFQHLWLAERAAHLAAVGVLGGDAEAMAAARDLLVEYGNRYLEYPNRDNVLGPARLFFSTYLESIWLTDYLAAASLLREAEELDEPTGDVITQLADEAANLIGDFDEGLSNRQTWNNAALAAVAVWFEDEELLERAVEGPTGLLAHLLNGFGDDGMWYEGENYHLFALRGLLVGFQWVRAAGVDPFADDALAPRIAAALQAPALTALPDLTFPARKDSRFGISLAQPMYLELWEAGLGGLRGAERDAAGLADWLAALYAAPAPSAETFDSYLHEAGEAPPARRGRADLSWWMLLAMAPALEGDASRWHPGSALLESQGIAVLRDGSRYASLECGAHGGGHGHPDRLHLTLHDRGVHWLADPGAGSYVARDLFWYRSTLAHNAPRVDGVSQAPRDATCDFFDAAGAWSWVRGRFGDLSRTLVAGPGYLLDVLELAGEHEHAVELPWHLAGSLAVLSPGSWEPASLAASAAEAGAPGGQEFVSEVSRLRSADSPIRVVARARDMAGGETALALATTAAELFRATAPGPPGSGPRPFLLARESGRSLRVATVLTPGAEPAAVAFAGGAIEVKLGGAVHRHTLVADGWQIEAPEGVTRLRGRRSAPRDLPSLSPRIEPPRQTGAAIRSPAPPALDGTLRGFDVRSTLTLDHEDQYRRSEEPYPGSDELSAYAYVNWDDDALYCAVEVTKPEPRFRNASAPPLELDNEPDDIHSDGLQLYLRPEPEGPVYGWLIVPAGGDERLRVRRAAGTAGEPEMVAGDWSLTDTGYVVTLEIRTPGWQERHYGDAIGFDLLVNEIVPGRERRAGQLVWTGGGGWVYLRGDRHDPARLGTLELAGGRAR